MNKDKKWNILPAPSEEFLNAFPELPPIVARLLWNRNLREQKQIDEFLNPDYSSDLHDPYLFRDMKTAVDILFDAIQNNKRIIVHGDYDADGVCAAALLVNTLKKLGHNNVGVFLPHRETDGYGLNSKTVNYLAEQKTDIIITCDCGISNTEEIKLAKQKGIKVIITDHHTIPPELPPADAIIHPLVTGETYPDKGLSGGGVAFKLMQGLLARHHMNNELLPDGQTHEAFEKWQLDLASISTVGDMVPLVGESRTIVRYGLTVINKTRNLGLKYLLQIAGINDENNNPKRGEITTETLSFQVVPRINAAGRMDHANVAFELLTATDEVEAKRLAEKLNKNNLDRQKLTEQIVNTARAQIRQNSADTDPILFAYDPTWITGILGLIAGKIKDEFNKPTIIMGKNSGEITGSGRSIPEFNMIGALQKIPQFFHKFGGHPMACGFSLESEKKLDKFKSALKKLALKDIADTTKLIPTINIDAEVNLEDIHWELYDILQKFEPFGQKNEEPKYVASGLTIVSVDPVGQTGKHLRLMVKHNNHITRKTIGFGLGDTNKHPADWGKNLKASDKIDLVFTVGVNEWNGNRELQLKIIDIRKSSK
ncbi:MAG: single-stranded-DNA-specific exonuclease RecJ [Candidatus Magasanikbacteria bacterium RIFOXYD2_FULL_41_14]|uniref:Single-stranded-DNA-specific exonuclease RecJ n=1 Tax=Candidatus Magasanikbacteria bacterium RIFOXYD2_FULL_41_14 TaxID=1798709 RepID=A0A1F6PCQ8_9BACT|nr:MAG: single-stranded-DNA-specific exonuclease RecJ [Candidatus Magasanikbacteria bacterium RIFOXYD2_FULL_41_14]